MMEKEMLCVYNVIGTPVFYVGKLVDASGEIIKISAALMGVSDSKTGRTDLGPVPHASKASVVTLNMNTVPGVLLDNPSDDLVEAYKDHVLKAYSKLTLV